MTEKKELAIQESTTPAYLQKDQVARGSENAGADDITMPRIMLLQALSPQLDSREASYNSSFQAGDIINSLTGVSYGQSLDFIPVFFRKSFLIWRDRKKGGGMCGFYSDKNAALQAVADLVMVDGSPEDYEIVDTAEEFVLVVNEDGSLEEAILSLSKTKMKASRKLQSLIRMTEVDSFASMYALRSIADESAKGKFYNFDVAPLGFVPEEYYHAGEAVYDTVSTLPGSGTQVLPTEELDA